MLKLKKIANKTKEEWAKIFSKACHGHILWNGNAPDPSNPIHAYDTAHNFVSHAIHLGFFNKGNHILDLGCGNGRFGICFSEMDVTYEGVEPMKECVDFCKEAFFDYPHLNFNHTPVNSPDYGLSGNVEPLNFKLNYPDSFFDDVICYSVFTHLQTLDVAKNYIKEIKRVLKPNGNLFITFYRSPPNKSADPYFGRTVFNEWDILTILNGFDCLFSYGGHTDKFYDQWGMFCRLKK
jgi:SAM-dependent methyltransferase